MKDLLMIADPETNEIIFKRFNKRIKMNSQVFKENKTFESDFLSISMLKENN